MPTIPDKPRFRGSLSYPPTPASFAMPLAGARVRIYDTDLDGSDDLLVDTTTDNDGRFDKTATKAWQDKRTIRNGFGGSITIADVTDTAVFTIRVDDPATGHWLKLPFVYLGDAVDVPMVVNWAPPPVSGGAPSGAGPAAMIGGMSSVFTNLLTIPLLTINGTTIRSMDDPSRILAVFDKEIKAGRPIEIGFADAMSGLTFPFDGDQPDFRAAAMQLGQRFGLPNLDSGVSRAADPVSAGVILGLLFIMFVVAPLAMANAIFLVMMGVAIIYAINQGYRIELTKADTAGAGTGGGVSISLPLTDLSLTLTPPSDT